MSRIACGTSGGDDSSMRSTNSVPDLPIISPSATPTPSTLVVPAVPRPGASPPPGIQLTEPNEEMIETRLKALNPSLAACYGSSEDTTLQRRECTPNTRKEVLSGLYEWRRDANQGNIFWMNGMAGTGKTTIANTLCATLKREQKLGASFFCTRQLPECRSVNLILPTIAYQLARFSRPFRDALSQALEFDPDLRIKDIPTQLNGMILSPLRRISEPLPTDLVVVIDALDQCDDRDGVEEILGVFMAHASALPIKVFISSRPEEEIRKQIGRIGPQVVLHELDNEIVKADIETYLREELEGTSVSENQLIELIERAGVLFIYAATVVRFVKEKRSASSQRQRLKIVLSASTHENKIDEPYSTVLASAFSNPKLLDPEKAQMRDILHTIVCAQEPLTADALAGLLQLDDGDLVLDALEPLWSVLHVSGSGGTSLVTTLHASFSDYMFDAQRSNEHCCNATSHHGRLAELCLERIERNGAQFNICELESSYMFDDQVPDLDKKVKQAIPLDLSYACQYWAVHLELGEWSTNHMKLLENFLSGQLLLWMEVMNLKKRMNVSSVLLEKARRWCTNGGGFNETEGLIHDAWRFATTFATNPVSRSTPHLYMSMLAFWPSSKLITDCYVKRVGRLAEVGGSGMTRRQLALLGVFPVGSGVASVVFSPDGTRIICGCWDYTIRVWDAQSGKAVLGPLEGHTDRVFSVASSPDGHRIASGSYDKTIRVWDARSGKTAMEPLKGHTGWVRSVAFSPDSMRIVSGSEDRTIRVWDVWTGRVVLGPLEGHTDYVSSVAFSPNGMCIVSGSRDKKIRVWDSRSGHQVLGPLKGHTLSVESVAFSPDCMRIASGSSDKTIRVWDAQTGETILGPLKGCTSAVRAVAYSPDCVHIVSCSDDKAIRVWDTRSGQVVLGPLEGHARAVTSVAFSPDGMRIVSGSEDSSIHVWDVQSRERSPVAFDGHAEPVNSVAFAPDGIRIVSGSNDYTIRVWQWDLWNVEMVLGPLEGHTSSVNSVAFSPDSMRIVSGSWDGTIRVWDSQNGAMVMGPLRGHSSGILSVVFSPDGRRIISGSDDTRIRVWDAHSGNMVLEPLEGHTGSVRSVVVSLDGRWIVSGSVDNTIRVWDVQNGRVVLGPFEGHTESVNSVAISPDSTRIVSGSADKTLRVWHVQTGKRVLEPLKGHTDQVNSVAFSPNGMYIVSGSSDKTIRVWSAQTRELVLGPLHGHIQAVLSTSFSPDSTHIVSSSKDQAIRVWRLSSRPSTANATPYPLATPSTSNAVSDSQVYQPSLSHLATGSTAFSWTIDEDGWLVGEDQHLYLWVPLDLRISLMMPNNVSIISTRGSVQLRFDDASMGNLWAKCYIPASLGEHRNPYDDGVRLLTKAIISASMTCAEIIAQLESHGCTDLTSRLDTEACSKHPISNGGFGDIYSGWLENGTKVAIKIARQYGLHSDTEGKYQKNTAKELYAWSKCNHPNVARLMGLAEFKGRLAMISTWAENGTLPFYMARNKSADCSWLPVSTSICEGLAYLHENGIVHGDLKGANVLVLGNGTPTLIDFGNTSIADPSIQFTTTASQAGLSTRWAAPEILGGSRVSRPGDVYALGMTILETITGAVPFNDLPTDVSVMVAVVVNRRTPARPKDQALLRSGDGDALWDLLLRTWSYEPELRPSAAEVRDFMKSLPSVRMPQPVANEESG